MTWLTILGTIAVIAGFIGIGVLVDRRWSILPRPEELAQLPPSRPKELHAPGAAAETAIEATAEEVERAVRRRRHCRSVMTREGDEPVRYGDRLLTVVRLRCAVCGERESVYFEIAPPA